MGHPLAPYDTGGISSHHRRRPSIAPSFFIAEVKGGPSNGHAVALHTTGLSGWRTRHGTRDEATRRRDMTPHLHRRAAEDAGRRARRDRVLEVVIPGRRLRRAASHDAASRHITSHHMAFIALHYPVDDLRRGRAIIRVRARVTVYCAWWCCSSMKAIVLSGSK